MHVKVSGLEGAALDYAVAHCQGLPIRHDPLEFKSGANAGYWIWEHPIHDLKLACNRIGKEYSPSLLWVLGGPIMERERIALEPTYTTEWVAFVNVAGEPRYACSGSTPLLAAMRCYVATKFGGEIDIPQELLP